MALADAFALARVLGAVTGCSDGGAGGALGWVGAAFARMTGGAGAATSTPFVVEALSAFTAALADAMKAFFPFFFRTPEAADRAEVVWSISRSISVFASPPDRAWARAAPSALERFTFTTCSIAVGGAGVTGCTTLLFLRIDVIVL